MTYADSKVSGISGARCDDGAAADTGDLPGYLVTAWKGDERARPGPRRSLNLRAIAAAGIALADEGGLVSVSMRSVGAMLGMTSMSLYRYVQSKDELLAIMIDEALGPADFPRYGRAGWRKRLTTWSTEARARYRAHPWVLSVSLPDPPALPNQIQWTERGLEALERTQLSENEKLSALLLVNVYVRGQVQLSSGFAPEQPGGVPGADYTQTLLRLIDRDRFPHLTAAMTQRLISPPADFAEHEFTFGLSTLLDGLSRRHESANPEGRG